MLQKGTRVQALNIQAINPMFRGAMGVVQGPGDKGTVAVLFEHNPAVFNVDPSVLEVIALPQPEPESALPV